MDWSDEHYVKLYSRDTLTWRAWSWQARTVFLHLLRRVDHAGFIETGKMKPTAALALQLDLPAEVVDPGLVDLLASGTAQLAAGAVLLPKFLEAQEARKSEAQKKRNYRERERSRRLSVQATENTTTHVPMVSPPVPMVSPTWHPPALPCPALPERLPRKKPRGKSAAAPKETDPRHQPLVAALVNACPGYEFDGGLDAKAVENLLKKADSPEVLARWKKALAHQGYPTVRRLTELNTHWNHFNPLVAAATRSTGPADASAQGWRTDGEISSHEETEF